MDGTYFAFATLSFRDNDVCAPHQVHVCGAVILAADGDHGDLGYAADIEGVLRRLPLARLNSESSPLYFCVFSPPPG